LHIIDTPGFGDTRGIIRDKAIVDQIREFFTTPGDQGISFLDAVCFVTQAPLARLTPPQRYIFDAILSVFGQDIASNIYVLITQNRFPNEASSDFPEEANKAELLNLYEP
jgi:hypothetical protein